jgi:hypothetical protein
VGFGNLRITRVLGEADGGDLLGGADSALGAADGGNASRALGGNESKALGEADGDIESTEVGEGVGPNTVNVMIIPASQCDPISQANVTSLPASLLWKV